MTNPTGDALRANAAQVKPLEWRREPIPPAWEWLASSPVGLYCVPCGGSRFPLRFRDTAVIGDFATQEEAKAAAQADYETRIRAALSVEQAPQPAVDISNGMPELQVSLIARAVRQSLRNYGHKVAESSLPECIAVDVDRALKAHSARWHEAPPVEQSQAAEIARLRDVLDLIVKTNQIREFMGDDKIDGYGDQGWVVRDGQYAKIARAALAAEGRE